MRRLIATSIFLLAATLACVIPVATVAPAPKATPVEIKTKTPVVAKSTGGTQVTISQAVVTIRQSPGGEATGKYVYSGDKVVLAGKCDDKGWCPVSSPVRGWIWRGCLAEIADGLLCQAKP